MGPNGLGLKFGKVPLPLATFPTLPTERECYDDTKRTFCNNQYSVGCVGCIWGNIGFIFVPIYSTTQGIHSVFGKSLR